MTHAFYRVMIVTAVLTASAAAVLALFETWSWALALLALAVAQVPALLHLQTRRFVRVSSTVGSRVSRGVVRAEAAVRNVVPASASAMAQDLARMQEILDRLETSVPTAPAPARPAAADQDVHATVNEFRRELRMTRLVLSELLRSQGGRAAASPVADASGATLR